MKKQTIMEMINEGISFLEKTQIQDGSFLSFSSSSQEKFVKEKIYRSIFPTTLILSCLNELPKSPQTNKIKKRMAKFLLAQKNENWSFNYWARNSEETFKLPYPDDLDDTFCALVALFKHNPLLIDASGMARIVSMLTFMEEKEGGPYRTWLTPPDAPNMWMNVDTAVNSNIAYFLSLQDVSLPEVVSFIEKSIDDERYSSSYYPSAHPIIYFISRFYTGEKTVKIRHFLSQKMDAVGVFENPLNTALSLSALLRLGIDPKDLKKSVAYLMRVQKNGGWSADAFCLDPAIEGRAYYAGSDALTTAFCLEALAIYEKATTKQDTMKAENEKSRTFSERVIQRAKKKFSAFDEDLRKEAFARLEKTLRADKDGSIVLLPHFFAKAIIPPGKAGAKISDETISSLCLANLYGWISYTIYDDFLDDEGDPRLLSLANACLRELTCIFLAVAEKNGDFKKIFTQTMDKLDSANAWEIANCRIKNTRDIPKYGNFSRLAERSLGHALGPLAILSFLGFREHSEEIKHLKKFFEHYLVARQLNDDAHDWEKDLHMGHINAVSAVLIKQSAKDDLPQSFSENEIATMQKMLWDKTIDEIAAKILSHVKTARRHAQKISLVKDFSLFEKLLAPMENSARKALKEKEQTLAFLKSY